MPRPGGEADKLGNQYEAVWTIEALIGVIRGDYVAITVEPHGEDGQGVEFHLETPDHRLEFHSVKRQRQQGDWTIPALCKRDKTTGRSVLGDLLSKRRKHPTSELRFVSSTGTNALGELTDRARQHNTIADLEQSLPKNLRRQFNERVAPLLPSANAALSDLRSLRVIARRHDDLTASVTQELSQLFYGYDSALRPENVRRMLSEYVLDHLGETITTKDLRALLHESRIGLRDWKLDKPMRELVEGINRQYLANVEIELINGNQISRQEAHDIVDELVDGDRRGALVTAAGGFGKSCVVAQCVRLLKERSIPVLCVRMDSRDSCRTSIHLGKQLGLCVSPAVALAGIADQTPCVLVVDQLDAMSMASGRNVPLWDAFSELCNDARSYPHMKMVLACRVFDLEHDFRLRTLADKNSGFVLHEIGLLSETDIREALTYTGILPTRFSTKQIEILRVPFHLLLFLQGEPSADFSSAGQLYDRYWERKRQNVRDRLGRSAHWTEVLNGLTERMSSSQKLFATREVVELWQEDVEAMLSEHVLVEEPVQKQLRFFHESFFDYAYARSFCASNQPILYLLTSSEQHLFRRAQVRQILAYRRGQDTERYLADHSELLQSAAVRFHIKRMVVAGLAQLDEPTEEEWRIAKQYVRDDDLSNHVQLAIRGHVGWFDLLNRIGVLRRWLHSEDEWEVNVACWLIRQHNLHDDRSAQIAALLAPLANAGSEWEGELIQIMSRGKTHKSAAMAQLHFELLLRGAYDSYESSIQGSDFWHLYHEAAEEAPRFVIDAVAIWFGTAQK